MKSVSLVFCLHFNITSVVLFDSCVFHENKIKKCIVVSKDFSRLLCFILKIVIPIHFMSFSKLLKCILPWDVFVTVHKIIVNEFNVVRVISTFS